MVFVLDLLIVFFNSEAASYWLIMLGVFAVFGIFYCLENYVLSKKFSGSTMSLDKSILGIIKMRNVIFFSNFIPVVQLFGLFVIATVGWLIVLV